MNKIVLAIFAFGLLANCEEVETKPEASDIRPPKTAAEVQFIKGVFDALQPRSIAENREFCGYIGLDSEGAFVATPAHRGEEDRCLSKRIPTGLRVIASYHTHGAYSDDYDAEVPSVGDLRTDIHDALDGYIATPGGRVWYSDFANEHAILECGTNCVISDVNYVENESFAVGMRLDLDVLIRRQK